MTRYIAAISALLCLTSQALAQAPANVRTLGAVGDGTADDTPAFESAIKQAATQGVSVFVPMGKYRLSRTLTLKGVAITGPEGAAWNADTDALPVLEPVQRDTPCIALDAAGAVRGLCIRYNWTKEPESGPAAILVTGVGAYVSNCKIMYPWDGIITDGINNVGRLNVENVFMVAPRNVGVRVTGTWDVPALRNVEVWNAGPVPRGLAKGIGFDLGKNDLIRLSDCFAFAMATGFLLRDEIPGCKIKGGTWGTMANCATDYCGVGIAVKGDNTISVVGGTFWDHGDGLSVSGAKARVRISGAEFRSNGGSAVLVTSADHVAVTGCSLLRLMEGHQAPAASLQGGRVVIQGCVVESATDGIVIGAGAGETVLSGNSIKAARSATTDARKPDAAKAKR